MNSDRKLSLTETFKTLSGKYWFMTILNAVERLAYWNCLLQLPVYIAQKDAIGGLHWDQTAKGAIFFSWALVQNTVPIFAGSLADKYGRKTMLIIASIIVIIGYALIGTVTDYYPFMFSCMLLGLGLGTFKPSVQGAIATELHPKNSALGWGIFAFLVNTATFFMTPITVYLKSISWSAVFMTSAGIFAVMMLSLFFIKEEKNKDYQKQMSILKEITEALSTAKVGLFVLLMAGFTILFMQFYETIPNFVIDWVDTSYIASSLNLPDFMLMHTVRGTMITYEWLHNINAFLIVLLIIPLAQLLRNAKLTITLLVGLVITSIGIYFCGMFSSGEFVIAGIVIYTIGEAITNPRFNEYMGRIAPSKNKSLYMGLLYISWAIGLAGGGLFGGWIYHNYGEKARLAMSHLSTYYNITATPDTAFNILCEKSGMSAADLTNMLWHSYHPFMIWIPFVALGLLSSLGLYFYSKKYRI